jgi:hypothetical protein
MSEFGFSFRYAHHTSHITLHTLPTTIKMRGNVKTPIIWNTHIYRQQQFHDEHQGQFGILGKKSSKLPTPIIIPELSKTPINCKEYTFASIIVERVW